MLLELHKAYWVAVPRAFHAWGSLGPFKYLVVGIREDTKERHGAGDAGRNDLEDIDFERGVLGHVPGLYALCLDLPLVLGALHVGLASGVRDACGSDAVRAAQLVEAFWRHLGSFEDCATRVQKRKKQEPWYPAALPLERAAALSPGLRGRSADDAYAWLDARRRGLGCGRGEAEATVAGNAEDGPCLIRGVEVRVADRGSAGSCAPFSTT